MSSKPYPALDHRHRTEARVLVRQALAYNGWRVLPAAAELGVTQSKLRRLLDKLGLREEYDSHEPARSRPVKASGGSK